MSSRGTCANCKAPLEEPKVFQGVIICEDCFKIVSHTIERTKKELQMIFLTYTDMLRVALIRGELRPPEMPKSGVTKEQFFGALARVGEKYAQFKTQGRSRVSPLRNEAHHSDGQVSGGADNSALPGGRELREMLEVQEGGVEDRRDPEGRADSADRVEETTGGIDG